MHEQMDQLDIEVIEIKKNEEYHFKCDGTRVFLFPEYYCDIVIWENMFSYDCVCEAHYETSWVLIYRLNLFFHTKTFDLFYQTLPSIICIKQYYLSTSI